MQTRRSILDQFRSGFVDGVVAIKCLDEGIDIPATHTAFLMASSRDPRQFIQRRGRILRKSEDKDVATIYDYIVTLPRGRYDNTFDPASLLRNEMTRVMEFAELALNRSEALGELAPVLSDFDLTSEFST